MVDEVTLTLLVPIPLQSVVVSWNEDVEIGRCVSKMLRLQCTWAWEVRGREGGRGKEREGGMEGGIEGGGREKRQGKG